MVERARLSISDATGRVIQRAHRPDYQLALYVGLLMLLGLITMYAIGPQRAQVLNTAYGTDYTETYFVIKQAVSLAIALGAFIVMALLPLSVVKRFAAPLLVAGLGASALLVLFGNILNVEQITTCTLGACRWFDLGPLGSFQPAELLKFGVLIFAARLLADKKRAGVLNSWSETIIPLLVAVGAALLFVAVFQKDLGTAITMVAIVASMLLVAGVDKSVLMKLGAAGLVVGLVLIVSAPHRMDRVTTFFSGSDESSVLTAEGRDSAYHITHAKIAIGSGGVMGVGIGNSVQATGYLPEAINDSVFAILGETFGFIGLVALIVLFTALLLRILRIADHSADPWMQYLAAGVFGWVASHIVLNVASMIGVFPLTGITLPLLSFGGTSMVFIAAAMGLVFAISRFTQHQIREELVNADSMRGRGFGRSRHASRRRSR
jgi:cell division protein FtsW